jgi:hypothetical protein
MVSSPAKQDRCYLRVIRLSGSPLHNTKRSKEFKP